MAEMIFTIGELCEFTGMSRTGLIAVLERAGVPLVDIKSSRGKKMGVNFGEYGLRTSAKTAWSYFCDWKEPEPLSNEQRFKHLQRSITWNEYKKIPFPFKWYEEENLRQDDKRIYIVNYRYRITCRLSDRHVTIEDLRAETGLAVTGDGFEKFKTFLELLKKKHREAALREIRFRCFLVDWYLSLSAAKLDYDIGSSDRMSLKVRNKNPFIKHLLKIPVARINLKYLVKIFPNDEIRAPEKVEIQLRKFPEPVWFAMLSLQYLHRKASAGNLKKYTLADIGFMCDSSAPAVCRWMKEYPRIKGFFSKNSTIYSSYQELQGSLISNPLE